MKQIEKLDSLIKRILKEELESVIREEDSRIQNLKKEIEAIKKDYSIGLLTADEKKKKLEALKTKYKDLMVMGRLKGIDLNEEDLQELSPETKYKAFNKAADQAFASDDDVQRMKRSSQADTFGKHISPEVMQKAKNIAKMIGDGVEVDIEKINMRDDRDVEMKVRLTFFNEKEDMATSFMITKSNVKREPGVGKHKVIMSEPLQIDEPAMRQIANLIKQIQTKELVDKSVAEDQTFVTADGTKKTLTPDQKKKIQKAKPGETIDIAKSGSSMSTVQEGEDEMNDDELKETPTTHDLAGKIAEVIDSLKAIKEAPRDSKHAKFAEKVMKHMEAAKTALEGLTGHEAVLEEKDAADQEKAAGKHLAGIRKHMSKVIKDKDTLDRIMNKMPISKAMELKKAAGGELDEEKVAKAMLKYVIKEGVLGVKKKSSQKLEEGKISNILGSIAMVAGALGFNAAAFNAMSKSHERQRKSDNRQAAVANLEKKLGINVMYDRKDTDGKPAPAAWNIDPKDFSKIDSLYDEVIKRYPEYKLDTSNQLFNHIKHVANKGDNPEAKQSMSSLIRAFKLNKVVDAVADNPKKEKDLADDHLKADDIK